MLTPRELNELRTVAVLGLTDTCAIQRRTEVRSGLDRTYTWADIATNVPCRIAEQGEIGREFEQGGSVVGSNELVLRLPFGTAVTNADRVNFNGTSYEVTRVLTRSNATVSSVVLGVVK